MAILGGIAAVYVVLAVVLWAMQERITFPAPRAILPDPVQTVGYGERIELRMQDGTQLVGWYLPAAEGEGAARGRREAALLWFYGNGETIGAIWPTIRDFRPPNAALLVVDYPGYGASGGRATEAGMYEAADLAYNALIARPDVDRHRVYVYGRSLGSAAATVHSLGDLYLDAGDMPIAERYYREALALGLQEGDVRLGAYCLAGLSCVAARNEDATTAGRLWTLAERLEHEIGFRMVAAERIRYERNLTPPLANTDEYRAGIAGAANIDPLTAAAEIVNR